MQPNPLHQAHGPMEVMEQHGCTTQRATSNIHHLEHSMAGQNLTDFGAIDCMRYSTADLALLPKPRQRVVQRGSWDAGCRYVGGSCARQGVAHPEARGAWAGAVALPSVQRVHIDASLPPDIPALQGAFNKTLTLWEHYFHGAPAVSVILMHGHSMWVSSLISLQTSLYRDRRHCCASSHGKLASRAALCKFMQHALLKAVQHPKEAAEQIDPAGRYLMPLSGLLMCLDLHVISWSDAHNRALARTLSCAAS